MLPKSTRGGFPYGSLTPSHSGNRALMEIILRCGVPTAKHGSLHHENVTYQEHEFTGSGGPHLPWHRVSGVRCLGCGRHDRNGTHHSQHTDAHIGNSRLLSGVRSAGNHYEPAKVMLLNSRRLRHMRWRCVAVTKGTDHEVRDRTESDFRPCCKGLRRVRRVRRCMTDWCRPGGSWWNCSPVTDMTTDECGEGHTEKGAGM